MERLTKRIGNTVDFANGRANLKVHKANVKLLFKRLAEYEDTGLTPEEIESFKENYEMSRAGVQNLSAKLVKLDEERKYWQNEALKWASELGEQKIERGKNERS